MFIRCFEDVHHTESSFFTLNLDRGDFDNLRYHQMDIDAFINALSHAHIVNKVHQDSAKEFLLCELCSEVSAFSSRSSRGFPKYDSHILEKDAIYIPEFRQKKVKDKEGREKVIGVTLNYAAREWQKDIDLVHTKKRQPRPGESSSSSPIAFV